MGDGPMFMKTSAPHSLLTYRMILLRARSISLDSTFKLNYYLITQSLLGLQQNRQSAAICSGKPE
jgi:hypothetical protein